MFNETKQKYIHVLPLDQFFNDQAAGAGGGVREEEFAISLL
jgi:hypothetical protein